MPVYVRISDGTAKVFAPSGGDVTFTPTSLADGAGRRSARLDLGSGARPSLYRWMAKTKFASALTANRIAVEIYLVESDGTRADGNQGDTDAAVSVSSKRANLQRIGSVVSDDTTSGEVQQASGYFRTSARYIQVVWWNASGVALTGTGSDHEFVIQPVNVEVG